jgi:trigger factor
MKVAIEEISSTRRALRVELPAESLLDKLEAAYRNLAKQARIPGFRPGKVPREVLRLHFRDEAKREALRELIPESYAEALKDANLEPVSEPQVDEVVCEEGQPVRYRASFEIKPAIRVAGYTGIQVYKERIDVTDAEIDQALEYLRERAAEYVPMPGWPALREDLIVIDYEGFAEGRPLKGAKGQNVSILLGARQFLPEFEQHLHGLKQGESREVVIEFPADHPRRDLAGKRVLFRVMVKDLKKKRVPELDDEFARSVGECQNVRELREKVRADLVRHKEREQIGRLKGQILDKLLAEHPFDPPESLVEAEVEHILDDLRSSLAERGATPSQIEEETARARARAVDMATKRVRASLLLEAVATQEGLVVSEEEVDEEVRALAAALNQDPGSMAEMARREGRRESIRRRLLQQKALDVLYRHATVVEGVNLVTLA